MLRKYVLPRLEQYGADLMLSGHSHAYERSRLISGHNGGLNPDGTLALADSPSTTFNAATHVVPQANCTVLGRPEVDGPTSSRAPWAPSTRWWEPEARSAQAR